MEAIRVSQKSYAMNDALNVLFLNLDEAIDDVENGRVVSEEEMWAELDAM